jgi:hypothetical protein
MSSGPLANLKVVDLSTVLAGPNCARYLADFGAHVIKVENPHTGDSLRGMAWRDPRDGKGLWWKLVNRNKQTVAAALMISNSSKTSSMKPTCSSKTSDPECWNVSGYTLMNSSRATRSW